MLSGRARLALLIAASLLLVAGTLASSAGAAVTESEITSPTGPVTPLLVKPLGTTSSQAVTVSGTTKTNDENASDTVQLGCFYTASGGAQEETVLTKVGGATLVVPVSTANGSFTTTEAALETLPTEQPCTLRAVPVGTSATEAVALFKGPALDDARFLTKGAEASKLTDDALSTTTLQGFWEWHSAGACGPRGNVFETPSLQGTVPVFTCAADLSEVTATKAPSIVIDAHYGYDVAAASKINSGAVGQPFLELGPQTFNTSTGALEQTETEHIVRCENAGTPVDLPEPKAAECVQFASTGVKLVRTVKTEEEGLQATVTDKFEGTDASAHKISLSYGEEQDSTGELSYEFPGESAFRPHTSGDAPTWSSAPPTMYFQATKAGTSEHENPRGAITLLAVPTTVKFTSTHAFELLYSELTVPALGALTFTQILLQAGFPSLSIGSPTSGAIVSSASVQVSGSATSTAGIASVLVNGVAVPVAGEGAWSASVPLHLGANTITAVAADKNGRTASRSITVTYVPAAAATTVTATPAGKVPLLVQTPGSPPVPAHASLVGKVTGTGGKVGYTLACLGTASERCNVSVMLYTVEKLRGSKLLGVTASQKTHTKRVVLASGTLSIPAGLRVNVSVKLDTAGRKLLSRFGKIPARLSTILSASAGAPAQTVVAQNVTIMPVKKAKKKA